MRRHAVQLALGLFHTGHADFVDVGIEGAQSSRRAIGGATEGALAHVAKAQTEIHKRQTRVHRSIIQRPGDDHFGRAGAHAPATADAAAPESSRILPSRRIERVALPRKGFDGTTESRKDANGHGALDRLAAAYRSPRIAPIGRSR